MLHIRPIKLRKWFPPGDPVATAVARLCILREDFLLELHGIRQERFEQLDANAPAFRRTYFWRNSLRTLAEIQHAMNKLNAEPAFREAMLRESADVREAFEALKGALNRAGEDFLIDLRNTIGAHLDGPTLQAGLDAMDGRREAFIEVGETTGTIHYKFATDLLWSTVLRAVPDDEVEPQLDALLRKSARLIPTVQAIDHVVTCSLKDRRLP